QVNRQRIVVALALLLSSLVSAQSTPADQSVTYAGVGEVDATWHVGASAGQYAGDRPCDATVVLRLDPSRVAGSCAGPEAQSTIATFDQGNLSTRRVPSYGIQSRLSVRALVVDGPDPQDPSVRNRVAIVKNDLYIPQDLLWRRTAQILEERDVQRSLGLLGGVETRIDRNNLTIAVSHNHSSPYYSSPSWGVWAFQDVFDVRFFEYYAQRMARAVEKAAAALVPVRMGAAVTQFDETHRHSFGPAIADDGTPAGYPHSDANHDLMVARFDEIVPGGGTKPLAILMNYALHPEFLDGNNLITGDFIAPLERMVDRETGATLFFTQGDVGTAEPERNVYHSIHDRNDYSHKEYAQAEVGARKMADAVIDTWQDVAAGTPAEPARFVPFQEGFAVKMFDRFFPGPTSHPYPSVSNCRTDRALRGNPQAPLAGLPDCQGPGTSFEGSPFDPGVDTDTFEAAGIPIPENYPALGYTGLHEDLGVHLQAVKLGDLLVTVCSCEQWKDQGKNIQTRTDRVQGNIYLGFEWAKGYSYPGDQTYAPCTQNPDTTWRCPDPRNANATLMLGNVKFRRMQAQIRNDAKGWNDLDSVAWAESEPTDPGRIKGNFTHEELPASGPGSGYAMTMTVAMANDYNGYLASYREYQRGDHYRKALTGWGPHSQDYFATRLVEAGGWLNGGPAVADEPLDAKETADIAHNEARARILGEIGAKYLTALEAALPADGGFPAIDEQPAARVERFGAAFLSWTGGSNYTDDPFVKVQRFDVESGEWTDFADMSGEVVVTLKFPTLPNDLPAFLTGGLEYRWTATWEVFGSRVADLGGGIGSTPVGTYRFVVDGLRRDASCGSVTGTCPYHLESNSFQVTRWTGITVPDIRAEPDGRVSFTVGPTTTIPVPRLGGGVPVEAVIGPIDYPDTYDARAEFIRHVRTMYRDPSAPNDPSKFEWYCNECSFRPWLDTGTVSRAIVTVVRADSTIEEVVAVFDSGLGRWVAPAGLQPGDTAYVAPAGITDAGGEINGLPSAVVTR
ncbi:MAG TPA: hypothetical protein VM841_09615, partial [Actinomycetota bacterium]|nr:hypothetical protein [Actinomycetota bacterium]